MLNSSNKFAATASILAEFLPTLDKLNELRSQYADDPFGKQYGALPGALKEAFSEMGAEEYAASVGEKIDNTRIAVLESEYSEEHPVGTVLRPVRTGMELKGNVIRMAECVASLGPENQEEGVAEEDEPPAPADEEETPGDE